jgi:hypothetical protein
VTRGLTAAALAAVLLLGACSDEQDPGVPANPSGGGPTTTSHLLSACSTDPAGTIPPEGCLDEDGKVVAP